MLWLVAALSLGQVTSDELGRGLFRVGRVDRVYARGGGVTQAAPLFEFAPSSSAGLGSACACSAITGSKGETVSWTRASSAYCTKSSSESSIANGDLVSCGNNLPRVMSLSGPLGVLVESARTNSALRSQEIDNAVWSDSATGAAAPTLNGANAVVAPDGTTTAEDYSFPATAAGQWSARTQLGCPAATAVASVYVKAIGSACSLDICATTTGCATCSAVTDSWTRCSSAIDATATTSLYVGNMTNFNGGTVRGACRVAVWQMQCEAGSYSTSPILTTSAAAARSAETASMLLSGITPATSGSMSAIVSFVGHLWAGSPVTDGAALNLTATANTDGAMIYFPNSTALAALSGSVAATQTIAPLGVHRYAVGWTTTSVSTYFDISTSASGTWTAPLNTQLTLQIGGYNTLRNVDSVISNVCYDSSAARCR